MSDYELVLYGVSLKSLVNVEGNVVPLLN